MSKDQAELFHSRESTRHFLHAKVEADEQQIKPIHILADNQKAIQSLYPGLLSGQAFEDHALDQLASASLFAWSQETPR